MAKLGLIWYLAAELEQRINCDILIIPHRDERGRYEKPRRFTFRISRKGDEHQMFFGPFRQTEAKRTIAMISDMVTFQLIAQEPEPKVGDFA